MVAHALPPLVDTSALLRRGAKAVLPVTTAAVDTAVALPVAVTVTIDTVVCLLAAVDTPLPTLLAIHTIDTDLLLAVVPSRPLPCAVTLMTATVEEVRPLCAATTLLAAIVTTSPLLPAAALAWTIRRATSLPVALLVTTLLRADTVTSRRPLLAVADTTICLLLLPAPEALAADTQTHHLALATTTLAPLLVAINLFKRLELLEQNRLVGLSCYTKNCPMSETQVSLSLVLVCDRDDNAFGFL